MTAIKERIIGAVSLMSDQEAAIFWNLIQNRYIVTSKAPKNWENIEEVEPDKFDLLMLKEIEEDPDCHEFISEEEMMAELGL